MFVVYLTHYVGLKLPPFYVGSTSLKKIENGNYFGSVKSKKWKKIFEYEIKHNKHLFSYEILSIHNNRQEAIKEELKVQIERNVVKSSDYFNESLATINGMFGRDVSGENNPMYGKTRPDSTKRMLGDKNIAKRASVRNKLKEAKRKANESGVIHWMNGRHHSKETRLKISNKRLGKSPPNKGKSEFSKFFDCIFSYINQNGSITKKESRVILKDISENQLNYIFQFLRKQLIIKKIGFGNISKWILASMFMISY